MCETRDLGNKVCHSGRDLVFPRSPPCPPNSKFCSSSLRKSWTTSATPKNMSVSAVEASSSRTMSATWQKGARDLAQEFKPKEKHSKFGVEVMLPYDGVNIMFLAFWFVWSCWRPVSHSAIFSVGTAPDAEEDVESALRTSWQPYKIIAPTSSQVQGLRNRSKTASLSQIGEWFRTTTST